MKLKVLLVVAILLTLLMGGTAPSPFQRPDIQRDLHALVKRGFTYRMLDNDLIELTDPLSGEKRIKSMREPGESAIQAWARSRGVPILEIDPTLVDTSKFAGWYLHWAEVPLSNGLGDPLLVDDMNGNGTPEVFGVFKYATSSAYESRVYEVDSAGSGDVPDLVEFQS